MRIWNRLLLWFSRPRLDRELADEIRAHQDMLREQFIREGLSPEDAHAAALRQFGSDLSSMEQSREEWGFRWLDAIFRDLRFATRMVRRQRILTLAAVLTVGLGVGANTAIFSVLETILLNPLGLRDAAKVVAATVRFEKIQMRQAQTSGVEFAELGAMTDTFSAVAAMEGRTWTADIGGEPSRLLGRAVTPDFFRVFDERPALGRFFVPEDRESIVLSHGMWQAQFGGSPSAIGRLIMLDAKPYRIVGVAPPRFRFPASAQAWTPLVLSPERLQQRGMNMNLSLCARLKDGITMAQAADRVNRHVAGIKSPDTADGRELAKLGYYIDLDSFAHYIGGDLRRPLYVLWAAALVLLFTACANVAALLLSRVAGRRREMAIRLSLGATRVQILRQLLIESLLLGALGGVFGIVIAGWAVSLLTRVSIPGKELLGLVTLDYRLILYGLGLALASGVVFGIAPAVQLLKESQTAAMKRGARRRVQDAFVSAEVAAALVLLIGTVLLMRSFWAVQQVRPGFDPSNLSTGYLIKPEHDPGFLDRLHGKLVASPGGESAALAFPLPFSGGGLTSMFTIRGRQLQPGEPEWHAEGYFVSPGYFETLRIPLVRGRRLAHSDTAQSPLVCVIDTALAERFFPGQDPVGHEIAMYKGYARVVGVAGTIRGSALDHESRPVVYYSLAQVPFFPTAGVVVRSPVPAGSLIRQAVRETSGSVPLYDLRSMEERIAESLGIRRIVAVLVCAFGGICLLLAAVGLHGVVAQIVGERAPEIGLRLALGAQPGQVMAQFLRYGLAAGSVGIAIGLAASAYLQKWLNSLLYGIQPFDLPTFGAVSAAVLLILLLAVFWPARRASQTDPQVVLRYE